MNTHTLISTVLHKITTTLDAVKDILHKEWHVLDHSDRLRLQQWYTWLKHHKRAIESSVTQVTTTLFMQALFAQVDNACEKAIQFIDTCHAYTAHVREHGEEVEQYTADLMTRLRNKT